MKLSHILYKTNNLSEAVKQFEEKGFKAEYGSKYNPQNALIYFSEGPYIEILEKAPITNFMMFVLKLLGKTHLINRFKSWENAQEGYFDISSCQGCGFCYQSCVPVAELLDQIYNPTQM